MNEFKAIRFAIGVGLSLLVVTVTASIALNSTAIEAVVCIFLGVTSSVGLGFASLEVTKHYLKAKDRYDQEREELEKNKAERKLRGMMQGKK